MTRGTPIRTADLRGQTRGAVQNPFTGGFVNPGTGFSGRTAEVAGQSPQERAAATRPLYETSPTGDVTQFNYDTGGWDRVGTVGGATMGAAGTRAAGGGGADQNALNALLAEIRGKPQPVRLSPTPAPEREGDPYDRTAESAAYTSAKERTGLAMQSALKGLRGVARGRGISGSTIEGDLIQKLFGQGLGELAGTDRQLAEKFADRSFDAENMDLSRLTQHSQFSDSFRNTQEDRAQQAALAELRNIISAYGMLY